MRRAAGLRAGLFLLAGLLGGCTPLYLPPVPAPSVRPSPRLAFEADSGLALADGRPELTLSLRSVPEDGWLALQWFGPDNREAASDSLWLEPGMEGLALRLPLPVGAEVRPGRWRVVLSFGREVVRQFSLEVEEAP